MTIQLTWGGVLHTFGGIYNMRNIRAAAREIIGAKLGVEQALVKPKAHLEDDLGADSMAQVELVLALEEAFDINIPSDAAERIYRVQDAVDCVVGRMRNQLVQ